MPAAVLCRACIGLAFIENRPDHLRQHGRVERLFDIAVDSGTVGCGPSRRIAVPADHQDRQRAVQRAAQPIENVEAVLLRQLQIEDQTSR